MRVNLEVFHFEFRGNTGKKSVKLSEIEWNVVKVLNPFPPMPGWKGPRAISRHQFWLVLAEVNSVSPVHQASFPGGTGLTPPRWPLTVYGESHALSTAPVWFYTLPLSHASNILPGSMTQYGSSCYSFPYPHTSRIPMIRETELAQLTDPYGFSLTSPNQNPAIMWSFISVKLLMFVKNAF